MNSSLLKKFYLNLASKFNLTDLVQEDMNISELSSLIEAHFPWPPDMLFTSANILSIVMYSVQLVVGLAANSYSLVYLLRERLRLHSKNRMVLLLIHLTCADLCVSMRQRMSSKCHGLLRLN